MAQTAGVLVPLDGSMAARKAIGPGRTIARQLGCRLELVTVYDPVRDTWERDLDRLAEETGYEAAEVSLVSSSSPADVIVSMAGEQPGTLVCMATQGRGGVDRMLLGSVTSSVLGSGLSPVLLVGAAYSPPGELDSYQRLIIASDATGRTVSVASPIIRQLARPLDLEVDLLAVATPGAGPRPQELERAIAGIAERLAGDGIDVQRTVLTADGPAESIASFVADRAGSLLVVAPRGHRGLRKLLVGSVTAELLSSSQVPVLVVQKR